MEYCGVSTGKYWQKVAEERRKKPNSIMLADKNAPNEEVWKLVSVQTLLTSVPFC